MNPYQQFIYKRTYSRWLEDLGRREDWHETVSRYQMFFADRVPPELASHFRLAIESIWQLDLMPSMRAMWTAGPALELENLCGYNCAYTPIDSIRSLAEVLYILLCGAGCGVSVERQYINQLPEVPRELHHTEINEAQIFGDSKHGWAVGYFNLLFSMFLCGFIPKYDLSQIRPKGSRLKTFGGRASGPEPLQDLIEFTIAMCLKARGRKLQSDEVSDLVCKMASVVMVGGVRRAAISIFSNPSDRRMAQYKTGQFMGAFPWRAFANISACYTEQPDMVTFMEDYLDIVKSGTGERGIVNRQALQNANLLRDNTIDYGLNPCGEVILRPREFCNLTEVVVRPGDGIFEVTNKIKRAVFLGCLQSTLTDFQFIDAEWKANCEEERLLGVSLTGIMDNLVTVNQGLEIFKQVARREAERVAKILGIPTPAAITCVKPSGTVSQLVNSSSGIHPRYSPFYIRRVRVATTDPMADYLESQGVPCHPEAGQSCEEATTLVFDFPVASPKGSIMRYQMSAIGQLEQWLRVKRRYCEHNPSVTIYVRDEEWLAVGDWLYKNFYHAAGITVLPYDTGVYQLAPYEEISEEKYEELSGSFPPLNWDELDQFERGDTTQGAREFACMGGACEL